MAKMIAKGLEETILRLENLWKDITPVFKQAVYAGAGVVADEIKVKLEENLNSPRSVSLYGSKFDRKTTEPTGDLMASFGISHIRRDENGNVNTKIGFQGYDRKNVANQLKARAMESGTSILRKRPFVRPALRKCRKRVQLVMGRVLTDGIYRMQQKG